ncbi:MAG: hypothetical protein JF602_02825 [Gemmatimonadetes bacterium]|nr:hypothetical protein [Gemmatimonadota bacterium]
MTGSDDPFFVTEIPRDARSINVQGSVWWVYEDVRTEAPFHGPALLFKGDHVARRIREYPARWRDLSDEELYALSWSR